MPPLKVFPTIVVLVLKSIPSFFDIPFCYRYHSNNYFDLYFSFCLRLFRVILFCIGMVKSIGKSYLDEYKIGNEVGNGEQGISN